MSGLPALDAGFPGNTHGLVPPACFVGASGTSGTAVGFFGVENAFVFVAGFVGTSGTSGGVSAESLSASARSNNRTSCLSLLMNSGTTAVLGSLKRNIIFLIYDIFPRDGLNSGTTLSSSSIYLAS